MEFRTLAGYHAALDSGRLGRGDVVFVSAPFHARLSEQDRSWLWRSAVEAGIRLVTDLEVEPAIVARRGWAADSPAAADAPRPRGPYYRDAKDAGAVILFGNVAAFERALRRGVVDARDCVQVVPHVLRALPATAYRRLEHGVHAAGACLCEGEPPTAVALYRRREREGDASGPVAR